LLRVHRKREELGGCLEELLAASRPATPAEAKRFGVTLRRGQFSANVRIITKNVVLPALYGADSRTVFLVPTDDSVVVTLADMQHWAGHAYVALEGREEMEWFAYMNHHCNAVASSQYRVLCERTQYTPEEWAEVLIRHEDRYDLAGGEL
jgi:hypothetical protein